MKIFQTYHMLPHIPQQSVREKKLLWNNMGLWPGFTAQGCEALCQSQDVSEQQSVDVT